MRLSAPLLACLLLLVACSKPQVKIGDEPQKGRSEYSIPDKSVAVDPDHGREVALGVTALTGTGGTQANGVAQASLFSDGAARAVLQLNIARTEAGEYYEAWLRNPATGEKVSLGQVTSKLGDARHGARKDVKKDPRDFSEVVITREQESPAVAGVTVAVGTLKFQRR